MIVLLCAIIGLMAVYGPFILAEFDRKGKTMIWVFLGGVVIFVVVAASLKANSSMPEWAKEPCTSCGSIVTWLKGKDSNSTGEAKFFCKSCGHYEHRGGMASELAMENWEAKK